MCIGTASKSFISLSVKYLYFSVLPELSHLSALRTEETVVVELSTPNCVKLFLSFKDMIMLDPLIHLDCSTTKVCPALARQVSFT